MTSANIVEIFNSIQGEGLNIGELHLFVRFANCNLKCKFCDTNFNETKTCNLQETKEIENPFTPEKLLTIIKPLLNEKPEYISFTGGEPLLQVDFLDKFLTLLDKENIKIKTLLETNGTLPTNLEKIIKKIDVVSMDIKLQSATAQENKFDKNEEFINIIKKHNKQGFIKLVVNSNTTEDEIQNVINIVKNSGFTIILQPEMKENKVNIDNESLMTLFNKINQSGIKTRIIPQTHKFLGFI